MSALRDEQRRILVTLAEMCVTIGKDAQAGRSSAVETTQRMHAEIDVARERLERLERERQRKEQ